MRERAREKERKLIKKNSFFFCSSSQFIKCKNVYTHTNIINICIHIYNFHKKNERKMKATYTKPSLYRHNYYKSNEKFEYFVKRGSSVSMFITGSGLNVLQKVFKKVNKFFSRKPK